VADVELSDWPVAHDGASPAEIRALLRPGELDWVLMVDADRRPRRWYSARDLDSGEPLDEVGLPAHEQVVETNATLHDALDLMVSSFTATAIVVDERGAYQGVVELDAIRQRIEQVREAARERSRSSAGWAPSAS
jgi:osmoprotectant transport system ATP-binding protein